MKALATAGRVVVGLVFAVLAIVLVTAADLAISYVIGAPFFYDGAGLLILPVSAYGGWWLAGELFARDDRRRGQQKAPLA